MKLIRLTPRLLYVEKTKENRKEYSIWDSYSSKHSEYDHLILKAFYTRLNGKRGPNLKGCTADLWIAKATINIISSLLYVL